MELLFFRVVNARYKDREYTYLKLLESHRQGDKIKHKQLVNLSGINQLPAARIKLLFDDLSKSLALYKEISELPPASCRHLKASYLLALENAFKVSGNIQDQYFSEVLKDRKTKHTRSDENKLFDLAFEKASEYGNSSEIFCWVENVSTGNNDKGLLTCFLLNGSGFPLKYKVLSGTEGEEIRDLPDLKIKEIEPEFFLAPACERLDNILRQMGLSEKEKGYAFREIFLFKQLAGWPGTPDFSMEKILICGTGYALEDEKVNKALLAVTDLKNHQAHVYDRIRSVSGSRSLPDQDLICTYFISYFFKRVIDSIMIKHNIQQQPSSPGT